MAMMATTHNNSTSEIALPRILQRGFTFLLRQRSRLLLTYLVKLGLVYQFEILPHGIK